VFREVRGVIGGVGFRLGIRRRRWGRSRWREGEVGGGDGKVLLDSREGELGDGAVGLFDLHALNDAGWSDDQGEQANALGHSFGDAVMVKLAPLGAVVSRSSSLASWVRPSRKRRESGGRRAAWRACARPGRRRGVEPAVVAVEDEDFAGRLVVAPAHEAGFRSRRVPDSVRSRPMPV